MYIYIYIWVIPSEHNQMSLVPFIYDIVYVLKCIYIYTATMNGIRLHMDHHLFGEQ